MKTFGLNRYFMSKIVKIKLKMRNFVKQKPENSCYKRYIKVK